MDQDTQKLLSETVEMFLDEGRMFSGYNITRVTRETHGIKLRHKEVREDIHELPILKEAMDFGSDSNGETVDWTRSQVAKKGSTTEWFYVYHRTSDDPSNFEQYDTGGGVVIDDQKQSYSAPSTGASLTSTGISVSSPSSPGTGGENSDGTFSPDSYKRLFIPTRFLREAGMVSGQKCYIVTDPVNNTVFLVKDANAFQSMTVTVKTVEKYGDIRLRSNTLRAANIDDCEKFCIENTQSYNVDVVKVTSFQED